MVPDFDIFALEPDGSLRWREAAATVEAAQARIKALAQSGAARQYVIFNQRTGQRLIVDEVTPAPAPKSPADARHALYHICRVDKEKLRWMEAAESVQIAEARIKVLKAFYPGDYLVLDYNPERGDSPPPWTPLTFVLSSLSL